MKKKHTNHSIKELIESGEIKELKKAIKSWHSPEIAELVEALPDNQKTIVFSVLPPDVVIKTFKVLDLPTRKSLIKNLEHAQAAKILNEIQPDDRTEFLSELPGNTVKELLKLLSEKERAITLSLLGYKDHSVGRLMTPDYLAVKEDWTVRHVLDYVREFGQDKETVNVIYVIDDNGVLVDDIRIREFLFVTHEKKVSDLMDHKFISFFANDEEEVAINVFRKNNRVALPVTDATGVLLGIVTIDDVLRLAEKEETEDIQKIGGMEVLDEPYMNIPFLRLMKKRSGWLIILFLGEMLTATAMGHYADDYQKVWQLGLFLPLIISSGGNSGSQASTLIIRAMALGEVTLKDWWRIMKREIFSGLFLGSVLGIIGFVRVITWTLFTPMYGPHYILIAFVVGVALIGVVLWGTLSGSMLPIILKRCGADPATSSAPFVATLVDVTGLIIYFSVATIILKGILL